MKFTYDFIKENIRVYNEAKSILPIISQYESGEVNFNSMRLLKLEKFAEFYNFIKSEKANGFQPIKAISFKELKSIIVDKTSNERFKKILNNLSQKNFIKLLTEDIEKFDRYLNGRWLVKPNYSKRRGFGKRSSERAEGLSICFVAIINWMISNEIQTSDVIAYHYKNFQSQDLYFSRIKWYLGSNLSIDNVPKREVDVTSKLLCSLVDFIDESKLDFRKLNSDFIVESLSSKIKSLMQVPSGTSVVSLVDLKNNYSQQILTKDKTYVVLGHSINNGFLRVLIKDDSNFTNYHDYKLFEDLSLQRDLLLSQLGII